MPGYVEEQLCCFRIFCWLSGLVSNWSIVLLSRRTSEIYNAFLEITPVLESLGDDVHNR